MPRKRMHRKAKSKPNTDHQRLVKVERAVKKCNPHEELKFVDEYSAGISLPPAGVFNTPLSPAPTQGVGESNRIGNDIFLKQYDTRLKITANSGVMGSTNVRVIHFIDKQTNGAVPPVSTSVNGFGLLNNSIITDLTLAPYNLDTLGNRYKILKDKLYTFNPNAVQSFNVATGATTSYCPDQKVIKDKFNLNMIVKYVASTATIPDLIGKQPFTLLVCDQAVLQPVLSISARVTYTDA